MHAQRTRGSFGLAIASVIFIATFASVIAACGTSRSGFPGEAEPEPVSFDVDAGQIDAPATCHKTCSRDLKKVLEVCDGVEKVVTECGADQGCGDAACVDACRSAELSKGSLGCSFWTLPADDNSGQPGAGSCFAAMVANTWTRPVAITAGLGGEPLDISRSVYTAKNQGANVVYTPLTGPLPPGEVAIVFLAHAEPATDDYSVYCPQGVTPALRQDPIRHGTALTRAFNIKTDAPVSAYSMFPYGGAKSYFPSGTMLLPTSSWDKSYVAVATANVLDNGTPFTNVVGPRTLQIIANEDGTKVEIQPSVDLIGRGDVTGVVAGQRRTYDLDRGQVLQISQKTNLSGSAIASNKPVGLFGGSGCTFIPESAQWCDYTHQQISPVTQWGREYALVPYLPRVSSSSKDAREVVPWSLVGAADGTVLEYEPARPLGAPATLDAGQMATFMTDDLVVVRSQDAKHPFHAAVYMTGLEYLGGASATGDPDFVVVPPTDQYLDRYVFFADHTYPETNLTVVRRKTAKGFLPVELDCAGEITGFQPLGTRGEYEYTWVRLTVGSAPQTFAKGTCGYGRHEAHSDGPFAVTVWGTGFCASYGYVGGMGSRALHEIEGPKVF